MVSKAVEPSHTGTVLLCVFACLLLVVSHTAAATFSELDGQDGTMLLPHPREMYHRLRASNPPLYIVSSLAQSIFPSTALPCLLLSYARTALTTFLASVLPALGNLDVDLPSSLPQHQHFPATSIAQPIAAAAATAASNSSSVASSPVASVLDSLLTSLLSSILPPWLVPEVGVRSLFPFLLVIGLVLYLHHDPSYPYMLHGSRPKLPPLPDLQVTPRLGHRVGSKQGRKLSAVLEEDDDSDDEMFEVDLDLDEIPLVRERGLDLAMRQQLSERQRHSHGLDCIAEESP